MVDNYALNSDFFDRESVLAQIDEALLLNEKWVSSSAQPASWLVVFNNTDEPELFHDYLQVRELKKATCTVISSRTCRADGAPKASRPTINS